MANATQSIEQALSSTVEKWRGKLLDIGNRNPLVNSSFNSSRGVVEIVVPDVETVWRRLVADSEAGADPMRFPWRRELVPPPPDWKPVEELFSLQNPEGASDASEDSASGELTDSEAKKPKAKKPPEWNPSLDECRKSKRLRDTDLLVDQSDRAVDRRLRTLDGYARLAMSEQGVHALYISFGFLKWFESKDSQDERRSPLILVPVTLSRKSTSAAWELTEAEDDAIDNLCLRQRMRQDFGLELPAMPDINELEERGARAAYLEAVRASVKECERWEVEGRVAVGLFAFPKVAMWKDLGDHSNSVINHPLCRAIAGDSSVKGGLSFGPVDQILTSEQLDDNIAPGEVKAILDCDSSQLEAVVAAKRGVSLVLDGPPGTGKSQTIANIIADALSAGRTVLFVSEKVSALDVVKRRLDDNGLGDFCLECHSSKANRKSVLYELEACLGLQAEVYNDAQPKLEEAWEKREQLNRYVRSVHRPRMPLGLSPYEIYGQVGRLTRLGFAGKSRCELPDPAEVDRTTFDSWMKLLGRAVDFSGVIRRHEVHPWRGCKLTSRSLSFEDDVRHHLPVLQRTFETIDARVGSLVADGLLSEVPNPATLTEMLKRLTESMTSPQVSESWLKSPEVIASTLLQKLNADDVEARLRARLAHYREDAIESFPFEAARSLAAETSGWFTRFVSPLPTTVRKQALALLEMKSKLESFEEGLAGCEAHVQQLIHQLKIPIRADLPLSATARLIELATSISECGTMKATWLQPESWTDLRKLAERATANLDQAEEIATALSSRISSSRLGELGACINDVGQLRTAMQTLHGRCSGFAVADVSEFAAQCRAAKLAAVEADGMLTSLLTCLGISDCDSLAVSDVKKIPSVMAAIADAGVINGAWADLGIRNRLKAACDTAIEDLSEANSLRETLSSRLSHRAFKASAVSLSSRASVFSSLARRLIGGFGAFRKEVAELYKDRLPGTSDLISDMERLTRFHRRIEDVQSAASEYGRYLPSDLDLLEPGAWHSVKHALDANGVFFSVVGKVPLAAAGPVRFDSVAARTLTTRLAASLEQFFSILESAQLLGEFNGKSLSQTIAQSAIWGDAATQCQDAISKADVLYSECPSGIHQLVEDVVAADRWSQLITQVQNAADRNADSMPAGGLATERATWDRIFSGVQAAERLIRVTKSTKALQEILCSSDGIDSVALQQAIDRLTIPYQRFEAATHEFENVIVLSPPDEPTLDPRRRSFAMLKEISASAQLSVAQRLDVLQTVAAHLLDESDIQISRLNEESEAIERLISVREEMEQLKRDLSQRGVGLPTVEDKSGIQWLKDTVACGPLSPLLSAVASKAEQRAKVAKVLSDIRATMAGDFRTAWDFLKSLFDLKANVSTGVTFVGMKVGDLAAQCRLLSQEVAAVDEWLKFARWRRDVEAADFLPVLEELLEGRYEPEQTVEVVSVRFYRKLFDHLVETDDSLAEFNIEEHERVRERFSDLDRWEIRAASTRIRQFQLNRTDRPRTGILTGASSELGILQREIAKKRKHMPLRRLFAEIPGVLQRLKPCIMMSPLSVSTFLETDQIRFDLVIFDEASQVFPWDAIGAIYRGNQTIVAGDEKQLPPTNFFSRADSESDDEDDIADFESILSLCKSINMPSKRLRWHYRSKREPLIAFSNRHFYDSDLVTFPSVRDAAGDAVRLEFVADGRWVERRNLNEAERVADLVIEHLQKRPGKSLGVIAFNMSQQRAIEDVIFDRRRNDPQIDAVFNSSAAEPMFIKNLENVQGDERDVIILSMAYGFSDAGKFLKNFGPLTKSGGERRLNVAVTRAKEEVIFVASVRSADMDLSGTVSQGAHLLKSYLEYAEKGVDSLTTSRTAFSAEADSPFEEEVAAALMRHGLEPVPQVGCGGFRIDMALKHPERPGEFCLGIECDGATYHSSQTARDRDRIRESVLESLGWRIVRVWSTDWVRDPAKQVARILAAYEIAVLRAPLDVQPLTPAEDEDPDLKPTVVDVGRKKASMKYEAIADVPNDQIRKTAESILEQAGATELDDLIKLTARELGFQRLGPRIRSRLEEQLAREIQSGNLQKIGDRVCLKH